MSRSDSAHWPSCCGRCVCAATSSRRGKISLPPSQPCHRLAQRFEGKRLLDHRVGDVADLLFEPERAAREERDRDAGVLRPKRPGELDAVVVAEPHVEKEKVD